MTLKTRLKIVLIFLAAMLTALVGIILEATILLLTKMGAGLLALDSRLLRAFDAQRDLLYSLMAYLKEGNNDGDNA